jgi:uncharacterized protein (DUF885 family)
VSDFGARFEAFLAEFFALNPLHATLAGDHTHDGRWPDMTEAGRAERLALADRWEAELGAFADGDLSFEEQVDRDLVVMELQAARFAETELRQEAWDPYEWVYLLGGAIFPLVAREFAPLANRLTSVAERLEGVPGVIDAARTELVGHGGRPVSRLHTETALKQLSGVGELADDALREGETASGTDDDVAAVLPRLREAVRTAHEALAGFETHLRESVLPSSEGEGRLGPELFTRKLRHTLRSDELTPERILERAEREYGAVRAEMVRIARELWPAWCGGRDVPSDEGKLVRGVLDAISSEHTKPDELLDWCREELARIEDFCRARDVVGLSDEPLEIRWTPVFLRAFGGAMLDSPGPLDRGQKAFFAITPTPDDWTPEQVESYLREQNVRQLRVLTIHEAVPGHYLQGVYANRSASKARAIFWSGVYAEGWAVYVTQVMMDLGYGADDPALLLVHWKFYLRAAINTIIDVRIHAHGMTEDEAVALMVDGGFQEESEARNKYTRARLTATQLSTYFVGSMEMWDIELERRRLLAGSQPVEVRDLPGGLGPTPGFRYREHLEAVMAVGAPPTSLLRRLLLSAQEA